MLDSTYNFLFTASSSLIHELSSETTNDKQKSFKINLIRAHNEVDQVEVANVALDEIEVTRAKHLVHVLYRGAVVENVQDKHIVVRVFAHEKCGHVASNEAGTSSEQNVMRTEKLV